MIINARIESHQLVLDRGFALSGYLMLERADGGHQGLGGFVLGGISYSKAGQHAQQGNFAAAWIVGVMRAADVEDLAQAVGKIVRNELDHEGFGGTIQAVGHALKDDRWFNPREVFQAMQSEAA